MEDGGGMEIVEEADMSCEAFQGRGSISKSLLVTTSDLSFVFYWSTLSIIAAIQVIQIPEI